MRSFKKHVLKKHINTLTNNETEQCHNNNSSLIDNDVIMYGINIVNNITIDELPDDVPLIPNQNIFDLNKSIQILIFNIKKNIISHQNCFCFFPQMLLACQCLYQFRSILCALNLIYEYPISQIS